MVDNFTGGLTGTLNNDTEVVAICQERMEDSQWTVLPLPANTVDSKTYELQEHPTVMRFPPFQRQVRHGLSVGSFHDLKTMQNTAKL